MQGLLWLSRRLLLLLLRTPTYNGNGATPEARLVSRKGFGAAHDQREYGADGENLVP